MVEKGTAELIVEASRAAKAARSAAPPETATAPVRERAALLTGIHDRSLDDKGRLVIPASMRHAFVDGVAIVPWPGPCVALIPTDEFLRIGRKLRRKQRGELGDPDAFFSLVASTTHAFPDGQGRIFIPEPIREISELPTDLAVVGQLRRIELWSRERCIEKVTQGSVAFEAYAFTEAL